MKRTLLLGMVAVALIAFALPVMAAPTLSTNGEVTYGIMGNGTTAADAWGNSYARLTTAFDANNFFVVELYGNNMPTVLSKTNLETGVENAVFNTVVDDLYLKTDVAGSLGLDPKVVDPVIYAGYGVYDLPDYNVTLYGTEGIAALGIDKGYADGVFGAEAGSGYGLLSIDTKIENIVNVVVATSGTAFTGTNQQALVGAYASVAGLNLEAGWTPHLSTDGYIPVGAQYTYKMGDLAFTGMAQYVANLNSNSVPSNWAAGLKVSYQGNYTVDAAILSYEPSYEATTAALKMTGDIQAAFVPNVLGLVISPWLNFDPNAANLFDTMEAFVWYKVGSSTVRVGYFYTTNGKDSLGSPNDYAPGNNGTNGGFWVTFDLPF